MGSNSSLSVVHEGERLHCPCRAFCLSAEGDCCSRGRGPTQWSSLASFHRALAPSVCEARQQEGVTLTWRSPLAYVLQDDETICGEGLYVAGDGTEHPVVYVRKLSEPGAPVYRLTPYKPGRFSRAIVLPATWFFSRFEQHAWKVETDRLRREALGDADPTDPLWIPGETLVPKAPTKTRTPKVEKPRTGARRTASKPSTATRKPSSKATRRKAQRTS